MWFLFVLGLLIISLRDASKEGSLTNTLYLYMHGSYGSLKVLNRLKTRLLKMIQNWIITSAVYCVQTMVN